MIAPVAESMLVFYTDGACFPNPGPSGFAVVSGNGEVLALGGEPEAQGTSQRAEGLALRFALIIAAGQPCEIRTDSMFWISVLTSWARGWERKGWQKKDGSAPKNLVLVQLVWRLYRENGHVLLTKVSAHSGEPGNELADSWAEFAFRQKRSVEWAEMSPQWLPAEPPPAVLQHEVEAYYGTRDERPRRVGQPRRYSPRARR